MKVKEVIPALALLAAGPAAAVVPAFQAYSNGSMMYAFAYSSSRTGVSVQVKDSAADDSAWTTVAGSFTQNWSGQNQYAVWTFKTNFANTLSVRIADVTSSGAGDYDAADNVTCTMPAKGTLLSSSSSLGPYAFDGAFNVTDTTWAGYDLGEVRRISKIRYIFRFDTGVFGWSGRWSGSRFQIADDASFSSNVSNVYTVSTSGYAIDHMREVTFDPPLETRYIRHYASSGFSTLTECEFLSPDLNSIAAPTFADYTFWQTNVVANWSIPASYAALSNRLERARSEEGPWTVLKVYKPGEATCYTDLTAKVGLKYFYRVRAWCGLADYYNVEFDSHVSSNYRLRCLERDLSNPKVLYSNATILRESSDSNAHYAAKRYAFDGNTATANVSGNFPDIWDKPHLGFDFGTNVYFGAVWYGGRINCLDRVNYLKVWGSNDTSAPTADPVALSGSFSCNTTTGYGTAKATNIGTVSYRYLYAWKDGAWYGNVCEMCLFGWTVADVEAGGVPTCPQDLAGLNGDTLGDVVLTWGSGVNLARYEVLCRKKGTEAWTTVADELDPGLKSHTVAGLDANAWYQFKLIGHGAEEDAESNVTETYVYQLVPGAGTGLRRILYGAANVAHLTTEPTFESGIVENAQVDQQGGTLFSSASHTRAWVRYGGKLIAPLDGTYTFSIETLGSDGSSFWVDGANKVMYGGSALIRNVTLTLTAGEHDIVLGYASRNDRKYLDFTWALANVWGKRVVPQSQLVPLGEAATAAYLPQAFEGWRCSLATDNTWLLPTAKYVAPGQYQLRGSASDFGGIGSCTIMTKNVFGPFTLDIDVVAANGRSGVFVTDANGSYANALVLIDGTSGRGMKSGAYGDVWSNPWPGGSARYQRLERLADNTLNFYYRNSTTADWTLTHTVPQGTTIDIKGTSKSIGLAGRHLRVGFYTFLNGSTPATIQGINLKTYDWGTKISVR